MLGNHCLVWIWLALPRQLQVKTENIYLLGKSMETSLKTDFAQISLAAQKFWVAQNFGGAAAPPAPPARTPMSITLSKIRKEFVLFDSKNNGFKWAGVEFYFTLSSKIYPTIIKSCHKLKSDRQISSFFGLINISYYFRVSNSLKHPKSVLL